MSRLTAIIAVLWFGILTACAQLPPESVTLSEDVGEVLEELRQKNASLVGQLFHDRKARINAFVDNVYGPTVVADAMKKVNAVALLKKAVDAGKVSTAEQN